MAKVDRIGTCLWFENGAVEAAGFYVSLFPDSRIVEVSTVSAGPAEGNSFVAFELAGRTFQGIDGGPMFKFTPAISFVVNCESQDEIDLYWNALSEGGHEGYCGWLDDRFGVSWQVVPANMGELMRADPKRVMEALLTMGKIDIGRLRKAGGGT
ncbi:MAG: VOC family protein [Gemmatimonadetes bacterium]|nr:VOC family protein [Gemmatimonadota bacterium]MYA43336.1 VOC family protein [Gemmatimonadota bacterium]MYE94302.1 VOC family protein [Gemmatimonadota bacterium]MYJ09670.1 VOC family protein [Gemmatimonadota bacterium]